MKLRYWLILLFFRIALCQSQQLIFSGLVVDSISQLPLEGAYVKNNISGEILNTDSFGKFSLISNIEQIDLEISYVGFSVKRVQYLILKDTLIKIFLLPDNVLNEIQINAQKAVNPYTTKFSNITVSPSFLNKIPLIFGERDILKGLQTIPGIQGGAEGQSSIYVRGGNRDQNMIMLENSLIYNPEHLFGFISTFDPDIVEDIEVFKGAIPSMYGGRLASTININLRDGNREKFNSKFNIGLLATKILVEGPLFNNNNTLIFSAKRSLLNEVLAPLNKKFNILGDNFDNFNYKFSDINLKFTHFLNDNNKLSFYFFNGNDKYNKLDNTSLSNNMSSNLNGSAWTNQIISFTWSNYGNENLKYKISLNRVKYDYSIFENDKKEDFVGNRSSIFYSNSAGIMDYTLNANFEKSVNDFLTIAFGGSSTRHYINQGTFDAKIEIPSNNYMYSIDNGNISSFESGLFSEGVFSFSNKLTFNLGLRLSNYHLSQKDYFFLEPRIYTTYQLSDYNKIYVTFSKNTQYLQLLSKGGLGLPSDLWLSSTEDIPPSTGLEYAIGYKYSKRGFTYYFDMYYKNMNNLINLSPGKSIFSPYEISDKVISGNGSSMGIETYGKKEWDNLIGEIAYTLSRSDRSFDEISKGDKFPFIFDRRHDLYINLSYQLTKKWSVSSSWKYNSGIPISIPSFLYTSDSGFLVVYYLKRGEYRQSNFHVASLNLDYKKTIRRFHHNLNFNFYNIYNRKNAYYTRIDALASYENGFFTTKHILREYNLFSFIPSFSYTISLNNE